MSNELLSRIVVAVVLGTIAAALTYLSGQLPLWAAVGLWVVVAVVVIDTWTANRQ